MMHLGENLVYVPAREEYVSIVVYASCDLIRTCVRSNVTAERYTQLWSSVSNAGRGAI